MSVAMPELSMYRRARRLSASLDVLPINQTGSGAAWAMCPDPPPPRDQQRARRHIRGQILSCFPLEPLHRDKPVSFLTGFIGHRVHHLPYDVRAQSADFVTPHFAGANQRAIGRIARVPNPELQFTLASAAVQFDAAVTGAVVCMADYISQRLIDRHRDRPGVGLIPADHRSQLVYGGSYDGKTARLAAHVEHHMHREAGRRCFVTTHRSTTRSRAGTRCSATTVSSSAAGAAPRKPATADTSAWPAAEAEPAGRPCAISSSPSSPNCSPRSSQDSLIPSV